MVPLPGGIVGGARGTHVLSERNLTAQSRRETVQAELLRGGLGNVLWSEAYQLPGLTQDGVGKGILEAYDWWRFEPHPKWVDIRDANHEAPTTAGISGGFGAFAARIPGEVRICYYLPLNMHASLPFVITERSITILDLESNATYEAATVDSKEGCGVDLDVVELGTVRGRSPVKQCCRTGC